MIIEKSLDQIYGHHQTQISAIESLSKGRIFNVLTSRNCKTILQEDSNVKCVLSTKTEQRREQDKAIRHDASVLATFLCEQPLHPNRPILIPTAEKHELRVCMKLLSKNPKIATFHLRILTYNIIEKLTGAERSELRRCIAAGSIRLMTETESLADLLHEKYDLSARNTFLLPCSIDPQDVIPQRQVSSDQHFKIGYLGGFRKEKGTAKLPVILADLKAILNSSDAKITLELVMQKAKHKTKLRQFVYNLKLGRSLRNTAKPKLEIRLNILDQELSPVAFIAAIHSVDLLLIPYELKAYHARGSGLIIDGVLAEKPIVYTESIGMSEFLGFGNAESAAKLTEFAPKIMAILQDIESYRVKTPLARKALQAQIKITEKILAEL